ncbi:MAG TPA: hypothetical protein VIE17_06140 [Methylophilaceae bacterium]|jgi:hypothetical protein
MTNALFTLPPLEELLVEGGDARILIDAKGLNKYGCSVTPDAGLVALGSSTASVISSVAFADADRLREQLLQAAGNSTITQIYNREMERLRGELLQLCGLDSSKIDVVFAASGTDIHLIAAQIAAQDLPTLAITVDIAETGSGVPAALAGKHFSSCTALGDQVAQLSQVAGCTSLNVVNIPIRNPDGSPRDTQEVDAEATRLVEQAIAEQQQVLLMLVDVSKTGLIAPSPACVLALKRRFADKVQVMVDACQFRISAATLQAYLELGFMVALTGSKFVSGPTFSGALLFNKSSAALSTPGLSRYSARSDWPRHLQAGTQLADYANIGLLLRWQAALHELRSFLAVPQTAVAEFLQRFADAVQKHLATHASFDALPTPIIIRQPVVADNAWDTIPTIFPFLLRHADGKHLSREQTMQIYRDLQTDLSAQYQSPVAAVRGQLGQPVMCGERDGEPVSALRVCASARMVVEASQGNADIVIERSLAVLDKALLLLEKL